MSEVGIRADAFVAAHRDAALALGERLADLIHEPEAFLACLRDGLTSLADPEFSRMTELVSPGTPSRYSVRGPLLATVRQPLRRALREGSGMHALQLAGHLIGAEDRDLRLFALPCLRRALADDPELSWQLLRRMAGRAADWIEVDSLAEVWAVGILVEDFRWAELEQLVYSPRAYERRLVGATLATLPHRLTPASRAHSQAVLARRAMDLVSLLMGDAEVVVQKALSWAIRNWTRFEPAATAELLRSEAEIAVRGADGARAWVIRDSLSHQPPELAASFRARLSGLRRDPRAPSTSIAAIRSAPFEALIEAHDVVAIQGDRATRSRA